MGRLRRGVDCDAWLGVHRSCPTSPPRPRRRSHGRRRASKSRLDQSSTTGRVTVLSSLQARIGGKAPCATLAVGNRSPRAAALGALLGSADASPNGQHSYDPAGGTPSPHIRPLGA